MRRSAFAAPQPPSACERDNRIFLGVLATALVAFFVYSAVQAWSTPEASGTPVVESAHGGSAASPASPGPAPISSGSAPPRRVFRSSPGYGFRGAPPARPAVSRAFDDYPLADGVYRVVPERECAAPPIETLLSVDRGTCAAACSADFGCIAFAYDDASGTCRRFAACAQTRPAARGALFVRSK